MNIKRLDQIEYVVFDEADRLFEMGFAEQLNEIIRRIPESRYFFCFLNLMPTFTLIGYEAFRFLVFSEETFCKFVCFFFF